LGDEGAACDATRPCAPELYCDALTSTCAPLPAESESCATLGRCAPGFFCDSALVCQPLPGAFESCLDSGACAAELDCGIGAGADAGAVCRPPELPGRVIGEGCELDAQCPLGADCVDEGTSRRCMAHGLAGSTCNEEHRVSAECAAGRGLRCEGEICVAAPTAGESCASGDLCAPIIATVCDGSACLPRAQIGEACEGDAGGPYAWCVPDAVCDLDLGRCVPRPITQSGGPRCPGE
jgi:hypothetical protein